MFPLPLTITVAPSRYLPWGLMVLHGLALAAAWLAQLPMPVKIALSLLLLASAGMNFLRRAAPVRLRCDKDGQLSLHAHGAWHPLTLAAPPVLLPVLTILRLRRADQKTRSLLILPDSLPEEDFRRLRVWLRWIHRASETDSAPARHGG